RASPDRTAKHEVADREIVTLISMLNLRLGTRSTLLFRAQNRDTCPEQFRLARPLSEKSQKQLILTTQSSSLENSSPWETSRFVIFLFSANYFFLLSKNATPPGVCQNKKSSSHFTALAATNP